MLRTLRFLIGAGLVLAVAGCGSLKDDLGLQKKAPDEFAVLRHAPLSLPPDFNLRPPKPGEVGEGRAGQRDQARSLLVRERGGAAAAQPAPQPVSYSFVAGRAEQGLAPDAAALRQLASLPGAGVMAGPRPGPGERALLGRLNATEVDPSIRQQVDEEAAVLAADDRNLVERMMFWRKLNPPGVLVEPKGEAARIQENAALGKPQTEGDTPEIRVERLSSGFNGIKLF